MRIKHTIVLLGLIAVLSTGCNAKKEDPQPIQTDSSEESVSMTADHTKESLIPYETDLLGAHGDYFFVPIDGKTYRYQVGDQWDAVYEKDQLLYQFDVDEFGERHFYKIYSFSSFPDHSYLSLEHFGPYGLEEEIVLKYRPSLKSDDGELQRAIHSDFVIMENGSASEGQDLWKDFYDKMSKGQPAAVRIGQYYTLDYQNMSDDLKEATKEDYPVLFLSLLEYDGKTYTTSPLHYQDGKYIVKEEEGRDTPATEWKYLLHFTGNAESPDARYTEYDRYVLCNENVSWEKILQGMFSSQMGDYIPYREVYNEYTWKE